MLTIVNGARRKGGAIYSGPRKHVSKRSSAHQFSNHKARAEWFRARESWPRREAPINRLVRARSMEALRRMSDAPAQSWECVGPTNIGGRMTSVVCHSQDPERLLAGAAGGGLWRSDDAGRSWTALWHDEPTLTIGSLAVDPSNSDVAYCGTGEANLSADSHPGVGLYRSIDWGANWQILATSNGAGIPNRIGALAVDPFDSDHIALGGIGYALGAASGMYTSRDGGVSWTQITSIFPSAHWCHAVLFHPTRKDRLYATFTARSVRNGVWRSDDGGVSWSHLTNGFPDPSFMERTSIAIAPSRPDVMFACVADKEGGVLGIYRSANGGDSWTDVTTGHFAGERQMRYNNTIAIHPEDTDHVLCGGVDLHLTENGGTTWRRVSKWDANRGAADYAHADHHALLMPTGRPGWVYDMNDGGMDFSDDGGRNWVNRSDDLAVTMFYDMDVAQSDSATFGGGAQDNGTNITITGSKDDHFEVTGGDGGWIVIDPTNSRHIYTSAQGMRIFRFRSSDGWTDVSPLPRQSAEARQMWMVYIAMSPNKPKTLFTGTRRVWKTTSDGNNWRPVSAVLDGSDITAIEIARADTKRIYVGTENGGVFRSSNGGNSWSGDISGPVMPGRIVTRLRATPDDADRLFATVGNFGHGHVFRSDDGGQSWTEVGSGTLPDTPHHGIAIPAAAPDTVYVCNDIGVYVSDDAGSTWRNITGNLPNVMVVDLAYHETDKTLTAATYGRSLWRLDVS